MLLALQYAKGGGVPSYFPLSAIIDRFYARNQFIARKHYRDNNARCPSRSALSIIHISYVGVWAQPKSLIYCANFKTFIIATVWHKCLIKGPLVTCV
jgi:hypothetical protein